MLNRHHPADTKTVFKHSEFGRQKCLLKRHCDLAALGKRVEDALGFSSSGTIIERENPSKRSSPSHLPSDAMSMVSPIRKVACITLSSIPGCAMPGSGASLKRLSISISAPRAVRYNSSASSHRPPKNRYGCTDIFELAMRLAWDAFGRRSMCRCSTRTCSPVAFASATLDFHNLRASSVFQFDPTTHVGREERFSNWRNPAHGVRFEIEFVNADDCKCFRLAIFIFHRHC
jgi:hypothetical protein